MGDVGVNATKKKLFEKKVPTIFNRSGILLRIRKG